MNQEIHNLVLKLFDNYHNLRCIYIFNWAHKLTELHYQWAFVSGFLHFIKRNEFMSGMFSGGQKYVHIWRGKLMKLQRALQKIKLGWGGEKRSKMHMSCVTSEAGYNELRGHFGRFVPVTRCQIHDWQSNGPRISTLNSHIIEARGL